MNTILIIWTVVAVHAGAGGYNEKALWDWRPLGEFKTREACIAAATTLSLQRYHCISNGATQ